MVEDAGQLDVKICGDKSCCFTQHLNNPDTNFRPGKLDIFSGSGSIFECNNYEISDTPVERLGLGPVEMTVFHEGTDGIQLDYIGIQTDERQIKKNRNWKKKIKEIPLFFRFLTCQLGIKLDDGEFYKTRCFL